MKKIVISSSSKPSFLFWAVLVLDFLLKASSNPEGDALNTLKRNLKDPNNVLQNWDASLPNPCTWFHVTCNEHSSVIAVDLGNQDLSGTLVSNLGRLSNLQYLELYNNSITGKIPEELGNLVNLVSLDLYLNNISGTIPNTFGKLQKLRFLRLNDNTLSGRIPVSLTNVSTLQVLDLSNNNLEGDVPVNGSFSLFTPVSYQNNPHLKLKLPKIIPAPASSGSSNTGAIAGGVAAGATLLFAAPAIALACWRKRKPGDQFFDVPAEAEEHPEVHLGLLKKFSLRELLVATDNFSEKNILGEGGFAKVYKGRLADGTLVAVKKIHKQHILYMELEFQREVEMISMAVHRNVIRLRGFCMTSTERLLVYPYMANGSLLSWLRERSDSEPPLKWQIRKNIALGSATGLAYLHDHCDPKIIHNDVKPANILLNEEFEAFVGDFGLAKLLDYKDTDVSVTIRGTVGFIAPEYQVTGKCSEKNDVYGYGMTLLELITGRRIYDLEHPADDDDDDDIWLPDRVKKLLKDKKVETLLDAELKGNYDIDEAEQLIQVALLCIQYSAMKRPKMSEVVRMLEGDDGLAKKWEQWQKDVTNRQEYYIDDDMHHHNANRIVLDSIEHNQPEELSERSDSEPLLKWQIRKNIALGSATGLAYLHDHCDPKIIHNDVKTANILLNEEFEAFVGDFGLAKLLDYKDTHVSVTIRGTVGFIAPEYHATGKCSIKIEVYGYRMTLLELITGRRIYDLEHPADDDDNIWLHDRVKGLVKDKKVETLVDAELKGNYDVDEAEQLIQVALLCTQFSAMKRPKMSEVVRMLEGDDGLAKKWEQWQKEETNPLENPEEINYGNMHHRNANRIVVDSAEYILPDELSGPR